MVAGRTHFVVRTRRRPSVDVLVDDGVLLSVYDDAVMVMVTVVADGHRQGRQHLVRGGGGGGVMVVVAGGGHQHGRGRRVTATAGLVRQRGHPVAAVRAGATGARAVRPARRLRVLVERFLVRVLLARVRHTVGLHRALQLMVRVMVAARARPVDQRQRLRRFLKRQKREREHIVGAGSPGARSRSRTSAMRRRIGGAKPPQKHV